MPFPVDMTSFENKTFACKHVASSVSHAARQISAWKPIGVKIIVIVTEPYITSSKTSASNWTVVHMGKGAAGILIGMSVAAGQKSRDLLPAERGDLRSLLAHTGRLGSVQGSSYNDVVWE